MAADPQKPNGDVEDEVWGAIAAFESILEAMPNDRASLEALSHAYGQIGDHAKAADYLSRLGRQCLAEADVEAAAGLLDDLRRYEEDPKAKAVIDEIETLSRQAEPAGAQPGESVVPRSERTFDLEQDASDPAAAERDVREAEVERHSTFRISEELALAWMLLEAGELTQDEYAAVVQDLSEMSASAGDQTVSVLHVLEGRGHKSFDRITGYVARESGAPFVSLGSQEFHFQALSLLPLEFCTRRGALAFDTVGSEVLVAVLNPFDDQLKIDAEHVSSRSCHFFVAIPSEFDQMLHRYRETLEHGSDDEEG